MPLEGPRQSDRVTGYYDDRPRCNDTDGGRPGGCRSAATMRIVLIHDDGTESRYGTFCTYHGSGRTRFWSPAVAVEYRNMDGTVIRRAKLRH